MTGRDAAPQVNGTSGRAVAERNIERLEASPAETFFTDVVPRFFVKLATSEPRVVDPVPGIVA